MSREIKFRAWDGKNKVMVIASSRSYPVIDKTNAVSELVAEDGYILLQYTGLRDKKGFEIYEGDIISDGHFNWLVEFYLDRFAVKLVSHENNAINKIGLNMILDARERAGTPIEVIGNAYEKPELLERLAA